MDPRQRFASRDTPGTTLSRQEISARLREVALFQGLGDADMQEILRISEPLRAHAGEHVFEEGARGDRFFFIVRGSVELRSTSGGEGRTLGTLRAGQAFGEMALLHGSPRSASAFALEDTDMLSVSRAAFGEMLGGDTLSARLLENVSKALWATSVRLASQQERASATGAGAETLPEFNRLLRARILPRVTPRVSGYDIAASTLAPRQGAGSTSWDWLVLTDGRPAFCVAKALRADAFSAQRLAAVRLLVRAAATEPQRSLGAMLTGVHRGLRAGWVEGLSGPVGFALVALADGAAEWVEAGPITGMLVPSRRDPAAFGGGEPPLGEGPEHEYGSSATRLDPGDRIVVVTGSHGNAAEVAASVLSEARASSSQEALAKVLGGLEPAPLEGEDPADVSGAAITRTQPSA